MFGFRDRPRARYEIIPARTKALASEIVATIDAPALTKQHVFDCAKRLVRRLDPPEQLVMAALFVAFRMAEIDLVASAEGKPKLVDFLTHTMLDPRAMALHPAAVEERACNYLEFWAVTQASQLVVAAAEARGLKLNL